MNVCDACSVALAEPEGYLATTRQVVSNPAYWEKAFSRLHELAPLGANVEMLKGGLAEQQAKQTKPWLLCADCAGRLSLATPEAREWARLWWSSGETFVPPGSGPVPMSEVCLNPLSAEVLLSGVPRPTRTLFFGRGFLPGQSEIMNAVQGFVMSKGKVTRGHFMDIPVECESRPAVSREAFFNVVDEARRWNPSAFILDLIVLDQRTGRDMVMLAIWEGVAAEQARPHFSQAVASGHAVPAGGRSIGTPAKAAERRPPKKWTRVLGWICLGWGIMAFIAGIGQMPRPGAAGSAPRTVGRPGATREMTPEEIASSFMGMGTVMAGIGAWLTLRRRPKKKEKRPLRRE